VFEFLREKSLVIQGNWSYFTSYFISYLKYVVQGTWWSSGKKLVS